MQLKNLKALAEAKNLDLEDAAAKGAAAIGDRSDVIARQSSISRVLASIKALKGGPSLPEGWPHGAEILPPALRKKYDALLAMEDDLKRINDYMKAFYKAPRTKK